MISKKRTSPAQMPGSQSDRDIWAKSDRSTCVLTRIKAKTAAQPASRMARDRPLGSQGPNLRATSHGTTMISATAATTSTLLMSVAALLGSPGQPTQARIAAMPLSRNP